MDGASRPQTGVSTASSQSPADATLSPSPDLPKREEPVKLAHRWAGEGSVQTALELVYSDLYNMPLLPGDKPPQTAPKPSTGDVVTPPPATAGESESKAESEEKEKPAAQKGKEKEVKKKVRPRNIPARLAPLYPPLSDAILVCV